MCVSLTRRGARDAHTFVHIYKERARLTRRLLLFPAAAASGKLFDTRGACEIRCVHVRSFSPDATHIYAASCLAKVYTENYRF
jgi:hypothetical protein